MSDDAVSPRDRDRVHPGRRGAPRRRKALPVRLLGPGGARLAARTVDVSRSGMLAEIDDPAFFASGDRADLLPFAARVTAAFPQGMDVFFADGAVQAHAEVVRLLTRAGDATPLLGCRFRPELSDIDCRLLGVGPGRGDVLEVPDAAPAARSEAAPAPAPAAAAPRAPSNEPTPLAGPAQRARAAGPGV